LARRAVHHPPGPNPVLNMVESSFLSGKVWRKTLPVVAPATASGPLPVKRLQLPQGELAQFYDADEPVRYLAYLELREGADRGHHYHVIKEEWLYLIHGDLQLVVQDIASSARAEVPLRTGDLAIIQPGIAHVLRVIKPGQAIEFSRTRFDPADIHRFAVT
jgi:hypothetical protein